ncbi:MAG: ABC-F family ATP-binding cassette domain-containing protein [Erysipelotrichaceae bacterium]|nr:ABC-F family ATP-binding cassette domain-containing protein [Erysipelotrichaceae bacterium]
MLKIDNLTIITSKGRKLVEDFSFVLNDEDKVALIGEEGNGKSTLLKIIAGVDTESYVSYSGKIITDGRIGYLPQSIETKYLDLSVEEYIAEQIDYAFLYEILNRISLDYSLFDDRSVGTLSGGERVKVSLVKMLYNDPDILLMDEPSNDLDLKTLIWLEEFIKNCDKPMIFVSHDETLLSSCANGILHLEQLKRKSEPHLSYAGLSYDEYLKSRNAFIDRNNMIAAKQKAQLDKQLEKWRRIYQKVEHRQNSISRGDPHGGKLLKKKMHSVKAQGRIIEEKKKNLTEKYEPEEAIDVFFEKVDINPNKVILDLKLDELKIQDRVLAKDISLHVQGKDKICIIGDNGTGKSTLIRIIKEKLFKREDIKAGYMPQNYYEVLDYSLYPLDLLWDKRSIEQRARIQSFLGALRFTSEEMQHPIAGLSDGQRCKILLIKLILDKCDVLILDEPSRNLSPLSGPIIRKILNEFNGCIISVSHDRRYINEVANKVYELDVQGLHLLDR